MTKMRKRIMWRDGATSYFHEGAQPKDIAVFISRKFSVACLKKHFLIYDIPYQVLGVKFL